MATVAVGKQVPAVHVHWICQVQTRFAALRGLPGRHPRHWLLHGHRHERVRHAAAASQAAAQGEAGAPASSAGVQQEPLGAADLAVCGGTPCWQGRLPANRTERRLAMQHIMHPVQPIRLRASKASRPVRGALGNKAGPKPVPREPVVPDDIQVRGVVHEAVLERVKPEH